jgi:hypothetical protein
MEQISFVARFAGFLAASGLDRSLEALLVEASPARLVQLSSSI